VTDIRPLITHDVELLEMFDVEVQGSHGGDRRSEATNVDNIHVEERPSGTSRQAAVRRLRKDRPDLLEKVRAGELSAHAAAIEAGFRKRATPLDRLRSAWKSASKTERAAFMDEVA
jgi:hypothetical protein